MTISTVFFGDSMALRLSCGGAPPSGNAEPQLGVENDVRKTMSEKRRPENDGYPHSSVIAVGVGDCDGVSVMARLLNTPSWGSAFPGGGGA